ncbi:MAG: antibiotic biosynthesis monooxygenase [Kiloniellales bacterium]|nr:antibiotic biosynthesis monooxygenase [Kiloniellales bacterium]
MFVVTVDFRVKEGHVEAFREAMMRQAHNSVTREANCTQFDVCHDAAQPERFFLYEVYADRAAFQAHMETTHFLDFDAKVKDWVAAKDVETWDLLPALES